MFQVPESMLYLYDSGKLDVGGKQGPPTVLTVAEEEILVQHAVHMSHIGYGHTKEQILDVYTSDIDEKGWLPKQMVAQGNGGRGYSENAILHLRLGCLNTYNNFHVPDTLHLKQSLVTLIVFG